METVHQVTHFHFVGNRKYWDNIPHTEVDLYFSQKAIQYLYNHFSLEFIKVNFPDIYIERCPLRFWYWQGKPNFGDLLTPYFLKRFCNPKEYTLVKNKTGPKVISCGSIMSVCTLQTLVYGAGIRDRKQNIQNGIIQIVRGPITRQRMVELNYACPPVYGDPGLLLPLYYHPTIQKRIPLGIIPHYLHYAQALEIFKTAIDTGQVSVIRLLNPNIEETIDALLECHALVSSSLHGLIVADAYGIPNKWIYFDDAITGDNTKYYDYFASVDRKDKTYISCTSSVETILKAIGPVEIQFDPKVLHDNMFFDETGIRPYTFYLWKKYIDECEILAYKGHWERSKDIITSLRPTRLTYKSTGRHAWVNKKPVPAGTQVQVRGQKKHYYQVKF